MTATSHGDNAPDRAPLAREIPRIHQLCDDLVSALPVDGVALTLRSGRDHSQLVYATDALTAALDELEFTIGEGPGLDCYRAGRPSLEPDLASEATFARWPGFSSEARHLGAGALFAFPMHLGSGSIGNATLYRSTSGPMDGAEIASATGCVDKIVHAVLELLKPSGQLRAGLENSIVILGHPEVAQATGMIAVQLGVSITEALARLRARAFVERSAISEIACDVIARRRRFTNDPI